MPLLWTSVDSSAINQIGYDPLNGDLRIQFIPSRTAYLWQNISIGDVIELLGGASIGSTYHRIIKPQGGGRELRRFAQQDSVNMPDDAFLFDALQALASEGLKALPGILARAIA